MAASGHCCCQLPAECAERCGGGVSGCPPRACQERLISSHSGTGVMLSLSMNSKLLNSKSPVDTTALTEHMGKENKSSSRFSISLAKRYFYSIKEVNFSSRHSCCRSPCCTVPKGPHSPRSCFGEITVSCSELHYLTEVEMKKTKQN